MRILAVLWSFILIASPISAQGCDGNGAAGLAFGRQALGTNMDCTLSGGALAPFWLFIDVAPGSLPLAGGSVCLAVSPSLTSVLDTTTTGLTIPGTGTLPLSFPLPATPSLQGLTLYSQLVTFDAAAPGGLGLSNPASVQFAMPDSTNPAAGIMTQWRGLHTATRLTNPRYTFIAGGGSGAILAPTPVADCTLYDHYTRSFLPAPPLSLARVLHTATRLNDGRVLIAGGLDGAAVNNWHTAEIYNPVTNTFSPTTNNMSGPRAAHTATLLNDGRVLIAGGNTMFAVVSVGNYITVFSTALNTTEIFDPVTNTFSPGPVMSTARLGHEAVKLPNGLVLLVGGINGGINLGVTALPTFTNTTQLFNPATNTFTNSGNVTSSRLKPLLKVLPSGNVLMAGGAAGTFLTAASTCEIRNASGVWSAGPSMPIATVLPGEAVTPTGQILVTGGGTGTLANFTANNNVFRFTEGAGWTSLAPLPATRMNHTCTLLADGTYMLAGGVDAGLLTYNNALIYTP
jgi:hypothetical protein